MLEICKFVHATVETSKGKNNKWDGNGSSGDSHSLFALEERLPLELFKGKPPADRDMQQLKYE